MSEQSQAEAQDLELFHDETLGTGSYGKVCKAKFCELPCAAKILHPVLFQFNDPHSQKILQRFEQECELLKMVRHPNVAQYLGVAHDPVSHLPVLLMELLDENLTHFLERSDEPLPYHLQLSLWYDIALALTFLHSKGIIHRDLSGNNVLLIAGSRAKVTDFGMSKLTVFNARMSRLTQCPGTPFYMSPEALREPPVYTKRLDVFSSGVVAVQIVTLEYPAPGDSMKMRDDPSSPSGVSFTPIAEVERRKNHIDLINPKHPMLPTIKWCLSDREKNRPSAQELCRQLASLKQAPEFSESMQQPTRKERRIEEQVQQIQQLQKQNRNQKNQHQQVVEQMRTEQQCTVQQMQTQITELKSEKEVLNTRLRENLQQLQLTKRELWKTNRDLQQRTEELQLRSAELQKALQGQMLQEFQRKVKELESEVSEMRKKERLIEQLPPAFVTQFTSEQLPPHMKKQIEDCLQEWERNLYQFRLFCEHPSSGSLSEKTLEVHKNQTLGEATERAYKVLELQECGVQLEQCQLVRYNEQARTLGKPFDEPKSTPLGEVVGGPPSCLSFDLLMEIQTGDGDGSCAVLTDNEIPPHLHVQQSKPKPSEFPPQQEAEGKVEKKMPESGTATMHPGRLHFNSKSGAESVSSDKEPSQSIQDSSLSLGPVDGQGLYESQVSRAVFTDDLPEHPEEFPVAKGTSVSGLIPRAPSGNEWSPSTYGITRKQGSDSDILGYQDVLRDLEKKAGEQDLARSQLLQAESSKTFLSMSLSWEEDAVCNQHLWHEADTKEACHIAESQYCQEMKLVYPKRTKVRCSACRILAHTTCIRQLSYEGYTCKDTFREVKHKGSGETVVLHHFLHRRKAIGQCKKCERGFGNWKKPTGKEVVGISCSWCGDSYHLPCYSDQMKREPCHLGPLRNSIIPSSWIVKVPPMERVTMERESEETPEPRGLRRRSRRIRQKKPPDDRASKYFTVKPFSQRHNKPLLVFINPKSGGNQGAKLMQIFQSMLNPRQVFDLTQGGPKFGLKLFCHVSDLRILACGGDGTVAWVLSVLDDLDIKPAPPVAVLPLGIKNDLARVLGWGGGYSNEPLDKILMHVDEGPLVDLDRWHLSVWPNPHAHDPDPEGTEDIPLHAFNNCFSVGSDAHVDLEFHLEREANPEKHSTIKNKFYGRIGGLALRRYGYTNLTDHLRLYGDGVDLTSQIRQLRLEAICVLNIPSYGAGTNPWGIPPVRDPLIGPQKMDDGLLEIVGFFTPTLVRKARFERIAQCEHIKLITDRSLPVQIDGEPCKLQPSIIEVVLKRKVVMVKKVPRGHVEGPLQGVRPSDRIKLSVSKVTSDQYDRMHSDLEEMRKIAFPLGIVVTTSQDTLKSLRPQINHYTHGGQLGQRQPLLAANWRYLDIAPGRLNRMFQVLPDQEENIFIGDMLSDGIVVVELDPSPTATPETKLKFLLSPVDGECGETAIHPLVALESSAERRKMLARNASYKLTTMEGVELSPPPESGRLSPVTEIMQEVPLLSSSPPQSTGSMGSASPQTLLSLSQEENVYDGDSEIVGSPLPQLTDTSDSPDPDLQDSSSLQKALLDAVKRGQVAKVKECYGKGAKLTATDSNGWTPLHHAARLGKKEVVQYLVENVPRDALDIQEDEKLQTALHKAAWFGYRGICCILVDAGASLQRHDYQGYNPYHKSIQSGDPQLQNYLRRKEREQRNRTEDIYLAI